MHHSSHLGLFVTDWICIIGCAIIALHPFISKRCREGWARRLFVAVGLLGIWHFGSEFAVNFHHFGFSFSTGHMLYRIHLMVGGILVGWLTALYFSGQMKGKATIDYEASDHVA